MGSSGWNRPSANQPRKAPKKPSPIRGIAAGLVVVAAAAAVFFFLFSGDSGKVEIKKSEKKPTRIAEVTPAPAPTNKVEVAPTNKVEKKEDVWLGSKVIRRIVTTNGVNIAEQIFTADGRKHWRFSDTTKPVFDNAVDQILAMTLADNGNSAPLPALGAHFEDELGEAIKKEIVINDDDSDEVKAVKRGVMEARKQLLENMAAGIKAQDVIAEHRRMMEHIAAVRMEAAKGLREYVDAGDMDGARAYVEKINPTLRSMGVMELGAPMTREEQHEERVRQYQEMKNKENQQ